MEKLLLVGAGGFGRVVLEHARLEYECAFVDDGFEIGTEICGCKVVGSISDLPKLYTDYKHLVVTIGNNTLRNEIYNSASAIGYDFPNVEGQNVYISPYAKIGKGCIFQNNVSVQNGAVVGDGVVLNPGVEIHNDSIVGDYSLIYTNTVVRTYAKVGNRVKIGSNVTICNEATVADDTVVKDGNTIERS